jgi:hypothetical protein
MMKDPVSEEGLMISVNLGAPRAMGASLGPQNSSPSSSSGLDDQRVPVGVEERSSEI